MKILAIDNDSGRLNALKHLESSGHLVQSVDTLSKVTDFLDRSFCQVLLLGPQQVTGEPLKAFSEWRQSLASETSPCVVALENPQTQTAGIDHTFSIPLNKENVPVLTGLSGIPPEQEIFDYERALEICDDDPDLFKEIAGIFLKDGPGRIENLTRGMGKKYWPDVRESAHLMKGSALNLSAEPFRLVCLNLEHAAADKNSFLISLWYEQLMYEYNRLESYMKGLD